MTNVAEFQQKHNHFNLRSRRRTGVSKDWLAGVREGEREEGRRGREGELE